MTLRGNICHCITQARFFLACLRSKQDNVVNQKNFCGKITNCCEKPTMCTVPFRFPGHDGILKNIIFERKTSERGEGGLDCSQVHQQTIKRRYYCFTSFTNENSGPRERLPRIFVQNFEVSTRQSYYSCILTLQE